MAVQANPYPLRIDKVVMKKIKVIAAFNGRSVNKEIEFRLKEAIAEYESKNGAIQLPEPSEEELLPLY